MTIQQQILEKIATYGPIDMLLTETEYEYLHKQMKRIWRQYSWHKTRDYPLVLAFFRGYTFYRELSEKDDAFWHGFCEDLEVERPTNDTYDELEGALKSHSDTAVLFQYDGRGRAFVSTIDAIWGIRSLRAHELVNSFISYYREYPGEEVTRRLLQTILPDADKVALRQVKSFDHVFRTMTTIVDTILDQDLPSDNINQLEEHLFRHDIDLGTPNPLRFFLNKSPTSIDKILQALRFRRTPKQFSAFLKSLPRNYNVRLPDGSTKFAHALAERPHDLAYGRYYVDGQEHHVTPSARVTLNHLGKLATQKFHTVGNLSLYCAAQPFFVEEQGQKKPATAMYVGQQRQYLWAGRAVRGEALWVDGKPHPEAIGKKVETAVRLELGSGRIMGHLWVSTFLPQRTKPLQLHMGQHVHVLDPITYREHFTAALAETKLEVNLDGEHLIDWQPQDRLFTKSGLELEATKLATAPRELLLWTASPPAPSNAEITPASITMQAQSRKLWQVRWLDNKPLHLHHWTIQRPQAPKQRQGDGWQKRGSVAISLADGFFWHDEHVRLQADVGFNAAYVQIDGRRYPINKGEVDIGLLPAGRYEPHIMEQGHVVGALEPFTVLPELTLGKPPSVHFENYPYALDITLEDGRFDRIVYRPFYEADGTLGTETHTVHLDDNLTFDCYLKAKCLAVRFVYQDTHMPVQALTTTTPTVPLQLMTYEHHRKKLRLVSTSAFGDSTSDAGIAILANEVVALDKISFASQDELVCLVSEDARSDTWKRLASLPVAVIPEVGKLVFKKHEGQLYVTPLHDLDVNVTICCGNDQLREYNFKAIDQDAQGLFHFPLPSMLGLRSVKVQARVMARALPEPIIRTAEYQADFDLRAYLQRGLAWSKLAP
jgi:hypothetical protein